jgi:hypothetical protein
MNLDTKGLFDDMKDEFGSDFFEKLREEMDETSSGIVADMRQREIMLDKFIANGERDTDKMDTTVDRLYIFDGDPIAEEIIRKYIAYLATFNPEYAENRLDRLEETFGYKSVIVYAAGSMALAFGCLWSGCDAGVNAFYQLLEKVKGANNWKEKVALFIHHALKNTKCSIPELMDILDDNTKQLMNTPEEKWWKDWMVGLMDNDATDTHPLTPTEIDYITSSIHRYIQNGCN